MIEIIGEKVSLREPLEEDIDELYYWKYEEEGQEAKKWNAPYINEDKKTKEEYRQLWLKSNQILTGIPDSLIVFAGDKLIGTVGAYWVDENTNWLETGIVIYDKNFWSGGFGSEAYKLWIDFLFESTGLHRLGMSTWSGNMRMIQVAKKVGMMEEARIRKARLVGGAYYDAIKMGVLREEWMKLKS